jgi:hypothetical protein
MMIQKMGVNSKEPTEDILDNRNESMSAVISAIIVREDGGFSKLILHPIEQMLRIFYRRNILWDT